MLNFDITLFVKRIQLSTKKIFKSINKSKN